MIRCTQLRTQLRLQILACLALVFCFAHACMPKRATDIIQPNTSNRSGQSSEVKIIDPSLPVYSNGENPQPYEPLFFATLMAEGLETPLCGGSFAEPDIVRIAAHCVINTVDNLYILAPNFLYKDEADREPGIYPIKAIASHPGFTWAEEDDIALIFLTEKAREGFQKGLHQSIPAATEQDFVELYTQFEEGSPKFSPFRFFGRGNRVYPGLFRAKELRGLKLIFQNQELCLSDLDDPLFCAVQADSIPQTSRTCYGDSGSPAAMQKEDGSWLQLGLLSRGIPCAEVNQPQIFTRVDAYEKWVENTTKTMDSLDQSVESAEAELIQAVTYFCPKLSARQVIDSEHILERVIIDIEPFSLDKDSESNILIKLNSSEKVKVCSFKLASGLEIEVNFASIDSQGYVLISEKSNRFAASWHRSTTQTIADLGCEGTSYSLKIDETQHTVALLRDNRLVKSSSREFRKITNSQTKNELEFAKDQIQPILCGKETDLALSLFEFGETSFLEFSKNTSFSDDESFPPGKRLVWLESKKPIITLKFEGSSQNPKTGLLEVSYPRIPDLSLSSENRKILGWSLRCDGLTQLSTYPEGEVISTYPFAYEDNTYFFSAADKNYGTISRDKSLVFNYELESERDYLDCNFNGQILTSPIQIGS